MNKPLPNSPLDYVVQSLTEDVFVKGSNSESVPIAGTERELSMPLQGSNPSPSDVPMFTAITRAIIAGSCRICGAREVDLHGMWDYFAECAAAQRGGEWRFQGLLGFGGKVWMERFRLGTQLRFNITYYQEDITDVREVLCNAANAWIHSVCIDLGTPEGAYVSRGNEGKENPQVVPATEGNADLDTTQKEFCSICEDELTAANRTGDDDGMCRDCAYSKHQVESPEDFVNVDFDGGEGI